MESELQIVLCTVPDADTAEAIAGVLVTEKLAACVNIIPGISSVYRWEDAIKNDPELMLLIKTTTQTWPLIEQRIRSIHPYELPEIIAVPITTGQKDYTQWINDSLK